MRTRTKATGAWRAAAIVALVGGLLGSWGCAQNPEGKAPPPAKELGKQPLQAEPKPEPKPEPQPEPKPEPTPEREMPPPPT